MQKISFVNPMGDEITISPGAEDFIFESVSGVGAVETQLIVHTPAGIHGALYQGLLLADREVTLNLHVRGSDRQLLYERRSDLIRLLASAHHASGQLGELWYENDYGRWWIPAVVKQGPRENGRRTANFLPMQVVFYCPEASWRAEGATIDRMAYLSGGFKFPLCIPAVSEPKPGIRFGAKGYRVEVINTGDVPSPLTLEITGPAVTPTITNKATGEFIRVSRELAANDRLTVSTERGHKVASITRATGTEENAMGHVDARSTWFQLPPGTTILEYTSGNDTTEAVVIVKTWSRFGGV